MSEDREAERTRLRDAVHKAEAIVQRMQELIERGRENPHDTRVYREIADLDEAFHRLVRATPGMLGTATLMQALDRTGESRELRLRANELWMTSTRLRLAAQVAIDKAYSGLQSYDDVARALRGLRTEQGLTQEQLAKTLGITPGSVRHYEANRRRPPLDIAAEWAKACGYEFVVRFRPHWNPYGSNDEVENLARKIAGLSSGERRMVAEIADLIPKMHDSEIDDLASVLEHAEQRIEEERREDER
jgi:transcriptional regulator with XRE-family HTH domain